MNTSSHTTTTDRAIRLLVISSIFAAMQVGAQPAQKPLLANQTGAKPNLMVALDNSGSMAFTYHESYNVTNDFENVPVRVCPTPFSNVNSGVLATFNTGRGGDAIYNAGTNTYTCYRRNADGSITTNTANPGWSVLAVPARTYWNWSSQRSAEVNPIYYNPTVRYLPRVDGSGVVISPRDPLLPATVPAAERGPAYNVVWVSNQNSANFRYTVYQRNVAPSDYRIYHSMYADNVAAPPAGSTATRNSQGHVNTVDPAGFTSRYSLPYTLRIPQHIAYTATPAANPTTAFSYTICSNVVTNTLGQEIGCGARTRVDVTPGAAASYTIPTPNTRTDCTANVCTNAQEVANILNWYRWYSTRQLATSTAIGLALADTNASGAPNIPSKFDTELRMGYMPINDTTIANLPYVAPGNNTAGNTNLSIQNTPGSPASVPTVSRGVRTLERGSAANTEMFDWLYNITSRGGTPLHNAINQAANYYRMQNGVTENPWRTDPTDANSPEMSCRRSFNLLFSDGGWSNGGIAPNPAGPDFDNFDKPLPAFTRTRADGSTESFRYLSNGINTVAGRLQYVPFPSSGTGGLADITARYYWHMDMMTGLDNNIQTRPGQPTFWQNMTTYTVGYLVQPTGEVTGTGLTFNQIDQYRAQYALNGLGGSTVPPSFPTVSLINDAVANNQTRIDDFIHAGYTGGARAFSARSADDVKSIFNIIVSEILSSSGKDAGVSVSSGGSDTATLVDRLKYGVTYRTLDNSGEITAQELDAEGNVTGTRWTASNLVPAHNLRRVFSMSGTDQPVNFSGSFSALESDIQDAIRQGPDLARVANDDSFVNYLRGLDPVADPAGKLFRQRASTLGAMVNPPSSYMGGKGDFAYDLQGTVEGSTSYRGFTDRKRGYPASLFVATNAGMMHALDAENGNELAAVMPRRSLKRMLNYANEAYNFEYVLDGPLSAHDIYDNRAPAPTSDWMRWKHLSVGTGGRGEPLIYAVKSPIKPGDGVTPANRTPDRPDFLWETGPDLVSDTTLKMGYITNPGRSGQTMDGSGGAGTGTWVVAINNGHYNGETDGSKAGLIVLNPLTGEVLRRIPLPAGFSAGRGLSGVTLLRDNDGTKRVIGAYAGDANGNLWRFDLRGSPSDWKVSYDKPIFTEPNHRPIYGAPAWQMHPEKGTIVIVATGMMLEEADLGDTANNEAIYGIWDPTVIGADDESPFTTVDAASLLTQSVTTTGGTTAGGRTYYRSSTNRIDWAVNKGWTMPLGYSEQGERSIAEVQNLKTSVVITTTVLRSPADPDAEVCTVSDLPANFIYVLNARDGQHRRSFDIDNDNRLDDFSVAYVPGGGFARGVSIVQRVPAATEAIPPDPSEPTGGLTGSPNDPKVPLADSVREKFSKDEAAGESSTIKCEKTLGTALGTESGAIQLGVDCPVTGWSRSQYQLSAPPSN